jgi:site-specific DNA recombinase
MKTAAIWARVSSQGQRDLSLDGQVERVKGKLESIGYIPQHIFKVVWTSTNLQPCPEFQELRRLIQTKQIQAIGMLDRDRVEANGLQRLNFLADCKDNGVEPVVCQGVPFLEGGEGQLVELALALAKQKQVERASGGAKQGLSDRARLKGLPPSKTKVYGYKWNGKFTPDDNFDNAFLIWQLASSGMNLKRICKELHIRGIVTPSAKLYWQPSSIRAILTNPVYSGRIAALRYEKVEPKKRRKNTFGKTSYKVKPMEEWHFLEGLVDKPMVTWEQFLAIQQRLSLNKQYATRNAHHNFLLRGLIQCQECYARGVDRHYYGLGRDKIYVCSAAWAQIYGKKCPSKAIPCQEIEEDVKEKIRTFLENPSTWLKEANSRLGEDSVADIEQQIRDNEQQYQKTITHERYALEKLSPEAFNQEQILLRAKRNWLQKENARLLAKLSNMKNYEVKKDMIEQMRENLQTNLNKASNEDWRFILECLGTKIMAFGDGSWDVEINIPVTKTSEETDSIKGKTAWCIFPC